MTVVLHPHQRSLFALFCFCRRRSLKKSSGRNAENNWPGVGWGVGTSSYNGHIWKVTTIFKAQRTSCRWDGKILRVRGPEICYRPWLLDRTTVSLINEISVRHFLKRCEHTYNKIFIMSDLDHILHIRIIITVSFAFLNLDIKHIKIYFLWWISKM